MTPMSKHGSTETSRRGFMKEGATALGGIAMLTAGGVFSASASAARPSASRHGSAPAHEGAVTADELVASIREELQDIDGQIRNHPYVQALHSRRVSLDALKAFPGHAYHTVVSDLRSMAQLVHRFGHQPQTNAFFNGVLQREFAALEGIIVFGRKLGLAEVDLLQYEVTPEGFTYATFMAWQSVYGAAAAIVCGMLVNVDAWGHNCGQISQALQTKYGFSEEDTVFLDNFATLPSFEEVALAIIQAGLDSGVAPAQIRRAARLSQAYEKLFWDALATIANVQ